MYRVTWNSANRVKKGECKIQFEMNKNLKVIEIWKYDEIYDISP